MADQYAPQEVDLGGHGFPLKKSGMTQYGKWPKQENCKVTFGNLQKGKILSVLYKCNKWNTDTDYGATANTYTDDDNMYIVIALAQLC